MLGDPDVKQTLEQGFDIQGEGPEKFRVFVRSEVVKWIKVVKESGACVDYIVA